MSSTPPALPFHVFKFGGTSVATPERIQAVVRLIEAEAGAARRVVVVSALGGVTDRLIEAIEAALARRRDYEDVLGEVRTRHDAALDALAMPAERKSLRQGQDLLLRELGELLDGIYLLRECTPRTRDAVVGMGERLSAPLVAAAFRAAGHDAVALDATAFIRTDATFGEAGVDFAATERLVQSAFSGVPEEQIAIVTGFIAATARGVTTTLGRSGSDYTATILAGALGAVRTVIWTDVDGVLSADPRLVPEAFSLPQLSYREAAELAYFGAKVLHPRTMQPLIRKDIPLTIKNTLNPTAPGTLISSASARRDGHVKAVTSIRDVTLVMLEGAGMLGVPGISARAFGALADRGINVLLISQASSEQSICIVVREADADPAAEALREVFAAEIAHGDVSGVLVTPRCAIISVVGDYMRERPGLAGRMFSTLGGARVNVLTIAQGASEMNICAVIHAADARAALHALHETFALGRTRAHLFFIGAGVVGRAVLEQLDAQVGPLRQQGIHLRVVGAATSKRFVWNVEGWPPHEVLSRLDEAAEHVDLDQLAEQLVSSRLDRLIVVDATASDEVAALYPKLLEQGIAVVTPNKRANTQSMAFYEALQRAARLGQVPYLYETTVGAGLPILSTLRDLVRSGDRVRRVEAVLSGTLGFLFNQLMDGQPFAAAVREAKAEGYTEPDPRDDLSGEDVARKLLILAREIGLRVERDAVSVGRLVPDELASAPVGDFMERLSELDAGWARKVEAAQASGRRLHYVGRIEDGRLSVRVEAVDAASPLARLRGTDNMVLFTTDRYARTPLVVQGPGAGPAVTAAGILADIVRAAERMA